MRLFAALPIPDAVARPLLGVQHGVPGAKWRPRENLHITLAFYGDTPPVLADELELELERISMAPLQLRLGEAGFFGHRKPRSLWMGLRTNPALDALAGACRKAAGRIGQMPAHKRYVPHITLAYCKGTTAADAARFCQREAAFTLPAFAVERFVLYQSLLGKDIARYHAIGDYKLNGV